MATFFGNQTPTDEDDEGPKKPYKKKEYKQKEYKSPGERKPRKLVYTPAEDGTPPSDKTLEKLRSRGRNYCLYMLGESQKTEKQLRDKLVKRGYPDQTIENIIDELKEDEYIDDIEYARAFARDRQQFSHKGSRAIMYDLKNKGIDSEVVDQVAEEISNPELEEERARNYAESRMNSTRSLDKQKRLVRVVSALARRGYDSSMSFKVVKEVIEADEEEHREEDEE